MHVKHEFDSVLFDDSEILILGSMPSVQSRKKSFYYMHPNNRFYKILKAIFHDDFTNENIEVKKRLLKKHHIALYDVIEECDIEGSSDQSITNVQPTNIEYILHHYPIKKIFLNGKKAYELFAYYFPNFIQMAMPLPSSSSANASYSLEKLIEKWKIIQL